MVLFFLLKRNELSGYNIYNGKVIAIESVMARYQQQRGYAYGKRFIPLFEYYTKNDTIKTSDGRRVLYSNFAVGDPIKIIEDKIDSNQVRIYSLFFFWVKWEEILVLLLIYIIIYGFFKNFIIKKS